MRYKPKLGQGPRLVIEPTSKGLQVLFKHLNALKILEQAGKGSASPGWVHSKRRQG